MPNIEQMKRGGVLSFHQSDFQLLKDLCSSHPKVVPTHHHALDSTSITVPERFNQIWLVFLSVGMKPLLELVEHNEEFLPFRAPQPFPQ